MFNVNVMFNVNGIGEEKTITYGNISKLVCCYVSIPCGAVQLECNEFDTFAF